MKSIKTYMEVNKVGDLRLQILNPTVSQPRKIVKCMMPAAVVTGCPSLVNSLQRCIQSCIMVTRGVNIYIADTLAYRKAYNYNPAHSLQVQGISV